MSHDTTTDPTHATQPVTGLTGALATVYTELIGAPGATAPELATATGIGRSTAGKALAALEKRGLATRTPGEQQGIRHLPDRWHPTQQPATAPETDTPAADIQQQESTADPALEPASIPVTAAPDHPHTEAPGTPAARTENPASASNTPAVDPDLGSKTETTPPQEPTTITSPSSGSQKARLAPGALRQLVINHLTAHPGKAFTATAISRVIEKSSGAIANALVTLVAHGIAEQVTEKPRQYRLSAAQKADAN